MPKQKYPPTKLTFDFDASFRDAKYKIVKLKPPYIAVSPGIVDDTAFKNSFLQVFDVQIKEMHTLPGDHFAVTKSLEIILPPLLERYYQNNEQLVTAADLITYNNVNDWFKDIWKIITTTNIQL